MCRNMNSELTLKGVTWLKDLRQLHLLQKDSLASNAELPLSLLLGSARHTSSATLKIATP